MSAVARALGMDHATDTDLGGFDESPPSTAVDQPRVFEPAIRFSVLRQIASTGGPGGDAVGHRHRRLLPALPSAQP